MSRVTFSASAARAAKDTNLAGVDDDEDLDEEPGEEIESAPPLKVGEERQINSSGLIKKLIKSGCGWETPVSGDEVTVHYIGRLLDGRQFDSSKDTGETFTFKLGQGHVVSGLDQGILTMKKGEISLFTLPSTLAYGDAGTNDIPPGSDIQFEVELISWLSVVDVCKDGGIVKKILLRGDGGQPGDLDEVIVKYQVKLLNGLVVDGTSDGGFEFHINEGHLCSALPKVLKTMQNGEKAVVTVQPHFRYIAKLEDGTVFEKFGFDGEGPREFVIDEEQVITGLDQAAATMEKGEISLVTVKPEYGYGNNEVKRHLATVPASATLFYEVEMIDFVKDKESWELNGQEKIETAEKLKEIGNSLFKSGKYQRAAKKYGKAIEYISDDESFEYDEQKMSKVLRVSCWLNSAACSLKLKDFQGATKLCSKGLSKSLEAKHCF